MSDHAHRFLHALMQPYPDDEALRLEIRPLWPEWKLLELYPDDDAPWFWRSQTGMRNWHTLDRTEGAAIHAAMAADEGVDVYMGVLPRVGRKGGRDDVVFAAWLWCDVDGGEEGPEGSVSLIKRSGLPKPHLAVISGGGVHAYWRLPEVERFYSSQDRDGFKELLKRLVAAVGGEKPFAHADSTRADTASILRVPETWNFKRGREEPRPVRLVRFQPEQEAKTLTWWQANLPAIPVPSAHHTERRLQPGEVRDLPQKARDILHGSWPPGTRHGALRDLLAIARGICAFDVAALELLAETFAFQNAGRREWAMQLARDTAKRIQPHY
jgi:hypothetical protein